MFQNSPDADLGSLIHRFYEKHNEWNISSVESFNTKWKTEIEKLNNQLQHSNYYPIQWNAKYYTVKKFAKNCLLKKVKQKMLFQETSISLWNKIVNENIGGKIDLLVLENEKIKQIVDFKTGDVFEKVKEKRQVKEIYKQQLALYCAVILEKQNFIPELFLETMNGRRIQIEVGKDFITALNNRVKILKEKINSKIETKTTDSLANCTPENCEYCNYRPFCSAYKTTFLNTRIGLRIDLHGNVSAIITNEVLFKTTNDEYIIKNIQDINKYQLNGKCEIYNLFFPENDDNIVYETKNTVIKYEE
ncbi:MAG: PD-(D/E)XK nuclease family protein [Saprospiraceae bacterium]|nr:PD-(D/E)XK nuclease family protein [Candidatus Defluviibacterium haderslevense]